jgi:two-component system chemotaxis response regulator CheB
VRHPAAIVAIAASTGGPPALARILAALPANLDVPVVVVQHISDGFERGMARWLGELSALPVRVADRSGGLRAGEVLVAAPGMHLGVSERGATAFSSSPAIGGFRPSATYLFRSAAAAYGAGALAVVLTGMGNDGAAGLSDVKRAGGSVIAQDEDSSIVYGMPRAAVATGMVDRVLSVDEIAPAIARQCGR